MSPFETMKRAMYIDWHTLVVGLQHGWCNKAHLIKFAEECLHRTDGEISGDLITIVSGEPLTEAELLSICLRLIEKNGEPLSEGKKEEALAKWRFAHLSSLLESKESTEKKIDTLQELYSEFGFPEDMRSCSIYANDFVDPLDAARSTAHKLAQRIAR